MSKIIINSSRAPRPIGPYSQGVRAGNILFISGQIPVSPTTGEIIKGNITVETTQCMENILAIVKEAGGDLSSLIKTTIYLKDMSQAQAVNQAYQSFFQDTNNFPARAMVEVSSLPKDSEIEIEAIAVLPD